jgi:putative membrane protein
MSFVAIALAGTISVSGCNRNRRDTTAPATTDPAAVGTAGQNDRNTVTRKDQDFARDMAIANMAEIQLGKVATEKSANTEVKKFGQMMIDDHTKLNAALKVVASKYNVPVPSDLDDKHRALYDKLSKRQGNDFDREYMDAMVDGHEDVLKELGRRVDQETLREWQAEEADRVSGKKVVASGQAVAIIPEKSDNVVTMALNEWAAQGYPVVAAHLEAAKVLDIAVKKRPTN